MSRRYQASSAPTIPGTAVCLPRRSAEQVLAAAGRPVPQVPEQGDLVEHWHEQGLLDEQQRAELGGDEPREVST